MLVILSPAKTLDFDNARVINQSSVPEFESEANFLANMLGGYKTDELSELMGISDRLAFLNANRFKVWDKLNNKKICKQAVCAFKGEAFSALNVNNWLDSDFAFAQEHLRILSGLYGVLRPLDYIKQYRLEMGTKLATPMGKNLYQYWGDKITESLKNQLDKQADNVLINLASNEYYKSINKNLLKAEVITPVFKDFRNGQYKVLSLFAKRARGNMSSFIIKNRISAPEQIKTFDTDGYFYNDKLTQGNTWVFTKD